MLSVTFQILIGPKSREESSSGTLDGAFYVLMKYLLMGVEE